MLALCCHKYAVYWPIRNLAVFPDLAKISPTVCTSHMNACMHARVVWCMCARELRCVQ